MLKWLSEGSGLLAVAIAFATLVTAHAQPQSNKPIVLDIYPDLSLILERGSGMSNVVVTRDSLKAALEAATNGNHNERIYVRSARGVRLEDLMVLAIAAGSAGYKIAIVLQDDNTCERYLAMSEHDAQTFAATFFVGIIDGASRDAEAAQQRASVLRHYCEEHPTGTLSDAITELRHGMTPRAATGAVPNQAPTSAPTLSQSEFAALIAKLRDHWRPDEAIFSQPDKYVVVVRIFLDRDGRLSAPPQVVGTGSGPLYQAAAEAAKRAILLSQPFDMLSQSTYDAWKDMEISFSPRELRGNNR
jgi:biopolymer transport protein ExbD